jgi:two-component system, cell cycle sensor histidine kinase and response regulator CckA
VREHDESITENARKLSRRLRQTIALLAILWTGAFLVLFLWQDAKDKDTFPDLAKARALTAHNSVAYFLEWAIAQGRIYVPVSDEAAPDPNLSNIPERDVLTPSGSMLTLVNFSSIARMMYENVPKGQRTYVRVTSLCPLRPENEPDPWERTALKAIAQGMPELAEVTHDQAEPFMRLMRPIAANESCFQCHNREQPDAGRFQAGLSVRVPLGLYERVRKNHLFDNVMGYGLAWLLGIGGLVWGGQRLERSIEARRQAMLALKTNQNHIKNVLDSIQDGVCVLDMDLNVLRVNPWIERRFHHHGPLVGKKCYSIYKNRSSPCNGCPALKTLETGETQQMVSSFLLEDDSEIWLETLTYPLRDEAGQVVAVIEHLRDVTHNRVADDRLSCINETFLRFGPDSTENIRQLVALAGHMLGADFALYSRIEEGRLIAVGEWGLPGANHRFGPAEEAICREILEGSPEQAVFLRAWDRSRYAKLHPGLKGHGFETFVGRTVKSGGEKTGIFFALLKEDVLLSDEESAFLGVVVSAIGVEEERRRAAEALREGEERYRRLFNTGSDAIFVHRFTPEGLPSHFVEANDVACARLGYSREELLQMSCSHILEPDEVSRIPERSAALRKTHHALFEARHVTRSGDIIPVEVNAQFFELGGQPAVLSIVRDITDRYSLKQKEEQLQQSQKMEAIGRLAGGVAHDFNNLLTVIIGSSELMLLSQEEESESHRHLQQTIQAAQKASGLTRQLLAFSRKQILEAEVLNLNTVVNEMSKLLGRIIGEDVELQTFQDSDLGFVMADRGQLGQVILNLAVNAREAMPNGGRLSIETGNVILDSSYAATHHEVEPGPYVMLAVTDSGEGMDPVTLGSIFEPFFTTKNHGTGLGLATVYGIVRQSGGHIWVYSEPDQGTTFKIYLPQVEGQTISAQKVQTGSAQGGTETVLLVEDDSSVRGLTRTILEKRRYRVLEASSPQAALSMVDNYGGLIDLMVTDVIMPDMYGPELAALIRSRRPEIKVLYMSGYTDNAIVSQGVLNDGMQFLQKPFTVETLARKVREVLDFTSETVALSG